jgi:hypothetical protein
VRKFAVSALSSRSRWRTELRSVTLKASRLTIPDRSSVKGMSFSRRRSRSWTSSARNRSTVGTAAARISLPSATKSVE